MTLNLLLATDLLEGSHALSLKALSFSKRLNANLSIIHIIETPLSCQYAHALGFSELIEPSIQAAKSVLATLADELEIPPERQYIRDGKAAHTITELALELNIDGIIIGAQGHTALPHLLGSTANSILHTAHCDVLTLKAIKD